MKNVHYSTDHLPEFYSSHRIGWEALYPSEKVILEKLPLNAESRVIDLGSACGGLGVALRERFGITAYTGIDISADCIAAAPAICPHGDFHAGDFLDLHETLPADFDLACSLGAADWNVQTEALLAALAEHVKPGGHLLFTCRTTNQLPTDGMVEARQAIVFAAESSGDVEYAPYKVYALPRVLQMVTAACPARRVLGYGYWGDVPSAVEGLPWSRVFYLVLAVEKAAADFTGAARVELDVALDMIVH